LTAEKGKGREDRVRSGEIRRREKGNDGKRKSRYR